MALFLWLTLNGTECPVKKTVLFSLLCGVFFSLNGCKPPEQQQPTADTQSAIGSCPDTKAGCLDKSPLAGLAAKKKVRSFIWTLPLQVYTKDGQVRVPLANVRGKPVNYYCFYRRDVPDENDIFPYWSKTNTNKVTAQEMTHFANVDRNYSERMYALLCSARTQRLSKYGARADLLETELKKTALKNEVHAQWMNHVLSDVVNLAIIFAGAAAPVIAGGLRGGILTGAGLEQAKATMNAAGGGNILSNANQLLSINSVKNVGLVQLLQNTKAYGTVHLFAFPSVLAAQSIISNDLQTKAQLKALETSYFATAKQTLTSLAAQQWNPTWDMEDLSFPEVNNITKEIARLGETFRQEMARNNFTHQALFHDASATCGAPYEPAAMGTILNAANAQALQNSALAGLVQPWGGGSDEQVHPFCQQLAAMFRTPPDNEYPDAILNASNLGENVVEFSLKPLSHPQNPGKYGAGLYDLERVVRICLTDVANNPMPDLLSAPCQIKRISKKANFGQANTAYVAEESNMFSGGKADLNKRTTFTFRFKKQRQFKVTAQAWLPGKVVSGLPRTPEELAPYIDKASELRVKRVCQVGTLDVEDSLPGHKQEAKTCWRYE